MIKKISLFNWRNFNELSLDVSSPLVIFLGDNAVGKTSILEAIYYISTTKSHRTSNVYNTIKNDKENASILIETDKYKYSANLNKMSKNYFINGIKTKPIDFATKLKTVIFSPEDLNLIKGSREDKRKFLDLNISLIDNNYLRYLVLFRKVLKERNELLKLNKIDYKYLKIINEKYLEVISFINKTRFNFINKINDYLAEICQDLGIIKISLTNDIEINNLANLLEKNLNRDIYYKTSSLGPHRDGFNVLMADKDTKIYASQGQIRLCVIAIKLALYNILKETSNPILLLDDVFAELDDKKQISLISYLNNQQTFITTTSLKDIPNNLLQKALVIKLERK